MASSESTNTPSRGASTPPSIQPSSSRASSPTHSGAATHTSTHSSAVSYTPMQAIGHPGTTAYASIQAGATVYTVRHPGTAAYIPMQSGATSYTPMQSGNAAYTPMQPGTAAYIPIYPGSMTYYSAQPGAAVNHVQSNAASPSSSSSPSRRPPTTAISFISASTSNRPGAGAASRQSGSTSFSKQSGGGSSSKQSGGGSSSLQSGGVISSRQFGGGSSSRQSGGDPSSRQSSGVSSSRQSGGVSSSRQLGAGSSSRQLIAAVSDAEEYTHTGNGPRWVDRHYDFILDYLAIGSNRKDLFGSDQKIPVGTKVKSSIQHWDVFAKSFNDNFAQFNLSGKTLRQRFGRYKARYESALRESERTGFGLTEADIARGIQTIQQLLDSLCYGFQRMNNYFWHTPGINPVSRAITGIDGLNMRLPKPRMRSSNRVEDDNDYNHNHGADSYAGSEYGESHPIAQAQPTVRDNNQYDNSFDMTSDGDLYDGFDASEDVDLPDNNGDADYIIEVNDDAQGSHHSEESDDEAPGLMQINEDAESDDCVEVPQPRGGKGKAVDRGNGTQTIPNLERYRDGINNFRSAPSIATSSSPSTLRRKASDQSSSTSAGRRKVQVPPSLEGLSEPSTSAGRKKLPELGQSFQHLVTSRESEVEIAQIQRDTARSVAASAMFSQLVCSGKCDLADAWASVTAIFPEFKRD